MSLFHFHKWSRWGNAFVKGNRVYQARWCYKCREAQLREVK
jgi:hypothetical protein